MLEKETKSEFLELYKMFEEFQKTKNVDGVAIPYDFKQMGSANIDKSNYGKVMKYSKDQIRRFLEKPDTFDRQLREVSLYLFGASQNYKGLINYLAKMLTFDYIIVPASLRPSTINDEKKKAKLIDNFLDVVEYWDNYNIKDKLSVTTAIMLREDIYFGYERTDGENYIWQQLPTNYCRIAGMDFYGTYTVEFNFDYFNSIKTANLSNYHEEFKTLYDNYLRDRTNNKWQKLSSENAIAFKFDRSILYNLPHFSGIFSDVIGIEEYKDIQEKDAKNKNYKLIHQKMPMKVDKDAKMNQFLLDDKLAIEFHANAKKNVPDGIGVVTSPMDITGINLTSNDSTSEDLVSRNLKNLFTTSGVSQILFNSDKAGDKGLEKNIQLDESVMFSILRQYELFFKKKNVSLNNKSKWKLTFLDTTIYNRADVFERYLKAAQFGYSKFFVATSLQISQNDYVGINYLENSFDMVNGMTPLKSTHTQSLDTKEIVPKDTPIEDNTNIE